MHILNFSNGVAVVKSKKIETVLLTKGGECVCVAPNILYSGNKERGNHCQSSRFKILSNGMNIYQ